jgi:hypothetical protein
MEVVKIQMSVECLGQMMGLPSGAKIVEGHTNDCNTIILSLAVEGLFPKDRELIHFEELHEVGAFIRDPMNPKYDPPPQGYGKGEVRGLELVEENLPVAERLPEEEL